eukprot:1158130-Pelagomonas_calceolata.AAC.10
MAVIDDVLSSMENVWQKQHLSHRRLVICPCLDLFFFMGNSSEKKKLRVQAGQQHQGALLQALSASVALNSLLAST